MLRKAAALRVAAHVAMALVRPLAGERRGIVIKGGGALERWARIQTVLFGKAAP